MIYLESPSYDAAFNLALEEYAFQVLPREQEYFMLWQNDCSVIVGKHQNAQEEVNLPYVKEHGIAVVRRLSGGGAVYHDLGNLNFTYIVNGENPDMAMERFAGPLLLACREFGIEAQITGRNDVLAEGRKFSGNARYQEEGRIMHHGTILICSDLEKMMQALKVSEDKFTSKGIASVRSRVANLSEFVPGGISVKDFRQVLKEKVMCSYGKNGENTNTYEWTRQDLCAVQELCEKRYKTWEWNYGQFPVYEVERRRRIEGCGTIVIDMNILAGRIQELKIRGDFLGNGSVEALEDVLFDCPLRYETIMERLQNVPVSTWIHGITHHQLAALLCNN